MSDSQPVGWFTIGLAFLAILQTLGGGWIAWRGNRDRFRFDSELQTLRDRTERCEDERHQLELDNQDLTSRVNNLELDKARLEVHCEAIERRCTDLEKRIGGH